MIAPAAVAEARALNRTKENGGRRRRLIVMSSIYLGDVRQGNRIDAL